MLAYLDPAQSGGIGPLEVAIALFVLFVVALNVTVVVLAVKRANR